MYQDIISKEASTLPGILERAVTFTVEGCQLHGMLAMPENKTPKHAILFSHGWSGNRNGPAGILTSTARTLAQNGCACLRFDFRGRGESQGDGLNATLATMSADLLEAAKTLTSLTGITSIILFGMCSGGNIAIGSLKQLPDAKAVIMLSVYPFSDGDSFGRDVHRTWHFLKVYLHKACSLQTWLRLFKGEASIGRVFRVIFRPFLKRGENKVKEEGKEAQRKIPGKVAKASGNESRLQTQEGKEPPKKYLANLRKNMPGVMVYGTADPDAAAAMDYYGKYVAQEKLPIDFVSIPGANHNFSSKNWHDKIAEISLDFCSKL